MSAEISTSGVLADAPGPGLAALPPPSLGGGEGRAEAEPEADAWAKVLAAWADEDAHRSYLARFGDLEGLAVAGGRYRDALARDPRDPVALRWRDEVVKRAMVQGLAAMPRARARTAAVTVRRVLTVLAALSLGALAWLAVRAMPSLLGASP